MAKREALGGETGARSEKEPNKADKQLDGPCRLVESLASTINRKSLFNRQYGAFARDRRLRVLACVAASALLERPFGLLLFALALQDRLLAFPRHDELPAVAALTTSANAVGLGPSLVHVERSPVELLPVERIDGGARRAVQHGHEGEAARPPGLPVGDHGDLLDIAVLGERVAKRVFIGVEAQVSYIDLHGNISKLVRVTPRLQPVVPLSLGSGLATLAKPNGHGAL